MKKKSKKKQGVKIESLIELLSEKQKNFLEACRYQDFKPRKKTAKEIAQEKEETKKRKRAEKILVGLKRDYSRAEKLVGEYEAREILHDALGISCDCPCQDW